MTDKSLAERLRASPTSEIMMEAADHIDGLIAQHHRDSKELRQLRAARDEARQIALDRGFALLKLQKEARALEADNKLLRVAITTIKEWPITSPLNMDAHNMQVVAHSALSGEGE